jgi:hypothetical protein
MATVESICSAVVTATGGVAPAPPVWVKTPGSDTAVPAGIVAGLTVAVGDRVQITVRTPHKPIVTAKETAT